MDFHLSDYADDVVAFLEQRAPDPAVLFGHSLGGIVAITVAARVPSRVRGLIVGDSPLTKESWGASIDQDRRTLVEWRRISGGKCSSKEVIDTLKNTCVDVPGRSFAIPPMSS